LREILARENCGFFLENWLDKKLENFEIFLGGNFWEKLWGENLRASEILKKSCEKNFGKIFAGKILDFCGEILFFEKFSAGFFWGSLGGGL